MIRALLRVVVPVVCLGASASAQDVKRIAVIAGSSHTYLAEKPEAVDEAVLKFFESTRTPTVRVPVVARPTC